ncbi:MAG: hypothetical protein AAGU75_00150 [Bacillota bacterium]
MYQKLRNGLVPEVGLEPTRYRYQRILREYQALERIGTQRLETP